MGIREKLNDNPAFTTGATIGIIVIAIGFIVWQLIPDRPNIPTKAYYTTDDSSPEAAMNALFADKINLVPPFMKDGKPAWAVRVFSCDHGKTRFIGWLERYTPAAQKKIEAAAASTDPTSMMGEEEARMTGLEIKKPGDKVWATYRDQARMSAVQDAKCSDGKTDNLEMQLP